MNKFELIGSANSRYFLELEGRELSLYRESKLLWKKAQEAAKYEVVGVGSNGAVVIRTDEGIYFHSLFSEEPEYYIESLGKTSLEETSSIIKRVILNNRGEDLCMERVQFESSMKSKLFNMFASNSGTQDVKIHDIIFFNIHSGSQVFFMQVKVKTNERDFRWEVSKDFNYILYEDIRASRKGSTHFKIAYTPEETVYQEFDFPSTDFDRLFINNSGTACIEGHKEERKVWYVVTLKGKVYEFTGPLTQTFCHLGRYFVVFHDADKNHLVWLTFDQKRKIVADLNHLDRSGLKYCLLFNEKDEIDYLIKREKGLEVYSMDMESFETETRRRARDLEEKKEMSETQTQKAESDKKYQEEQKNRTQKKIRELGQTFTQSFSEKDYEPVAEKNFNISESRKKMLLEISTTAEKIHRMRGAIPAEDLTVFNLKDTSSPADDQAKPALTEKILPVKPVLEPKEEPGEAEEFFKAVEEVKSDIEESKITRLQPIKLSPGEPPVLEQPKAVQASAEVSAPAAPVLPESKSTIKIPIAVVELSAPEPSPQKSVSPAEEKPEENKDEKPGKPSYSSSELMMILEKYKLRLITGDISPEDFEKVKAKIESRLKESRSNQGGA